MAKQPPISSLLLDEAFAKQDERFVEILRAFQQPKQLAVFTDRWIRDHRPWAREQLFKYLDQPLNVAGHEPVIKRWFKHAEQSHDDELMAKFTAVLDRLVRRVRRSRHTYDWQTRRAFKLEYLYTPRNYARNSGTKEMRVLFGPQAGKTIAIPMPEQKGVLFKYRTRHYLRRRAWRYYRRMGFKTPQQYPAAISRVLVQYVDDDLARGENILDSWSLLHACFGKSDVLEFSPSTPRVREGKKLAELQPAPYFPQLWQEKSTADLLLSILINAKSRLVRVWSIELLKRWHAESIGAMSADRLLSLLDHPNAEVQQFGAELFSSSKHLGTLPLGTWLRLLTTENVTALELIVAAMEKNVAGERLTLAQLVELACARPVPVVRLAMRYLAARQITSAEDRAIIAGLSAARCESASGELARFALSEIGTKENYNADQVVRFFDSTLAPMRAAAWEWLTATSPGWNDPALWSRLIESPYDDVKLKLVAALQERVATPGTSIEAHAHLWMSVLLGIYRGGRTKLIALHQVSEALRGHPDRAEELVPVIVAAIRSVRLPEARGGLAAIVGAVEARPELRNFVARTLPELKLDVPQKVGAA
jgi:hypothetical protein